MREVAMTAQVADKTARIRDLNDQLRTTFFQRHGRVMITPGIDALPLKAKTLVVEGVKAFAAFDKANDSHNEHDFGSFDIDDQTIIWKIDYYRPKLDGGSEDPSDPTKTTRVLTVMLAAEY
jgi:hypothetical protein